MKSCYLLVTLGALLWGAGLTRTLAAPGDPVISEFMAANTRTLADEDGDFSDWVEIHNPGSNSVSLNGWYLTDNKNNLTKWQFPNVTLGAKGFLVVFASGKDRRTLGQPLHTGFQLGSEGEYLGLVKPDGATVTSEFPPTYPVQAPDFSYGIPITQTLVPLVSVGAPAKLIVPVNDALGSGWTLPGFNDASWGSVTNGIGFEGGGPAVVPATNALADSVAEFSANQGSNGWSYGYWDKKADTNAVYEPGDFRPFPRGTGSTLASTNYWNGAKWDWPPPGPPTELTSTGGHPAGENGNAANPIHWLVRRYVSETNGPLRLTGTLACAGTNTSTGTLPGSCGDGVVGHIFVDGVEVFQRAAFGTSLGYSLIVNANLGSTIDFALDPGTAANDQCDTNATFTAVIRAAGDAAVVADTLADWSDTGVQGHRGWTYGYFLKTNSAVAYASNRFTPFPSSTGPHSAANFWNGELWHWFEGDPPFDTVGATICRPNIIPGGSSTNNFEHWVIRRWVSEITGAVIIDWHFSKKDLSGLSTSSDATAKIFHNGTQRDSIRVTASDFVGATRTVPAFNVQAGDVIDFTVEPGTDVVGDICLLNATIYGVTTVSNQFLSDVGLVMTNLNATAYLRIPFNVSDALAFNTLTLRVKYDDGLVAYLNGSPIASRNTPATPAWNAAATSSRRDAESSQFEEIDLTLVRDLLQQGPNVLAIHGLNSSATDSDFLITAALSATFVTVNPTLGSYFAAPTPGSFNGVGSTNLGPLITDVVHMPLEPLDNEDLWVTARVAPTLRPVGTVRLYYRVMFGSESNVVMLDDGLHADGAPGDGVYAALIPHTVSTFGQMVRYYVSATDTNNAATRQPPFPHPIFSAQYYGAVVANPALTNPLPVLHLFITAANLSSASESQTARLPCSLYWAGEFYDNVGINRHGQSSQGFPKKSYDIDFNADHHFKWDPNQERVDDVNLLTTYPDKGHVRNILSYETYRDSGPRAPYHFTVPVRVQTNGGFFGDWDIVENGDADFLKRIQRDARGALYKMYNTFTTVANTTIGTDPNAEKKTRKEEGNADLVALFNGVYTPNLADRILYMFDNINIAQSLNMIAARTVTSDWDCCHKNYYFYRDSEGTGEWEAFPWDVDLAYGRNWSSSQSYWDDAVYPQNGIYGNWDNNGFFQLLLNRQPAGRGIEVTRQMYLRRVRTLMDELQQPNGTPYPHLRYENRMDELAAVIAPDADLDLKKWGTWGNGATGIVSTNSAYWRTLPQSIAETKTNYLPRRRAFIFDQRMGVGADFPEAQPANVTILIGSVDYNPASANQAEEYIQLINTNNIAVDISGWKLSGAIEHTFQAGVVISSMAPSNRLYVVPDKKAFRARATSPRGGQRLFVEGNYNGQLSARGENLTLTDGKGRVVTTTNYTGNPSLAQLYLRITELMYHPAPPPQGSPYTAEEFEFVELKNIGPTNLNLTGVHFSAGIDFTFTGSTVTNLGAGAAVLVVKNTAAFASRYGGGFSIAGQYGGSLDNSGETIRLDDAVNEKILEFTYNNSWYRITDGAGLSLVISNDNAAWDTWDTQASWRPSRVDGGSPGATDGAPASPSTILVNEVLTHTDPPSVDAIELYNPNSNDVAISGWFISDDFMNAKKFRIPDNTIIGRGGYLVFYETNFGGAFAFSSNGDEAYLFSGDGTNLTGFYHGFSFGAAENGVSFGRYITSVGQEHFVAQSLNTLSQADAGPKVGPVVISEIMYRPPDLRGGLDNETDEYLELRNITGAAVPLYNPMASANTWQIRGTVEFTFPATNVTLAAGGHLLVLSFSPADVMRVSAFRSKYGVSASVPLFGPYAGLLANGAGSVELFKPDMPDVNFVPYVLVDNVDYTDSLPWPSSADGVGASLQRKNVSAYGNDPTNWVAATPSVGGPSGGGTAPSFLSQPVSQAIVAGGNTAFSANVTGSEPLTYQWRFNGNNLPGATNATLELVNVQPRHGGTYAIAVFNSAGSVESSNVTLTVIIPAAILAQPQSRTAFPFNSVTFSVSVSSSTPVTYQWRFNEGNINAATNSSHTLNSVQPSDEGDYTVLVTDAASSISSAVAHLTVLLHPAFTVQPTNRTVVLGTNATNVTLTAVAASGTPIRYQWQFNGSDLFRATNASLTLSNVQVSHAGPYQVIATDSYGSLASAVATLTVLVRPVITLQPINQSVVSNGTATFTIAASGTPPISFRWRRNNLTFTNGIILAAPTNSTLILTNVKPVDAATFNVAVTNIGGQTSGLSSNAVLTVLEDSDGDGIPDTLEPLDGAADTDGDGMNNAAELFAGTDYLDPASYLKVDIASGGGARISFIAVSNRTYTVQSTDGLSPILWSKWLDVLSRTNSRTEVLSDPFATTNRFYRLVTPIQR